MTLSVSCTCGKTYKVDEKLAGRKVKCKGCGASLVVPQPPVDDLSDLGDLSELIVAAAPAPLAAPDPFANAATLGVLPAADASPLGTPVPLSAAPLAQAPSPLGMTSTGALPFFLTVSSGWSRSLLYRVYVDRDALLFMDVCPYNALLDVEAARKSDGTHWGAKTVQALQTWVVSLVGVTLAVIGVVGVGLARFAFEKPNDVMQILSLLLTLSAIVIPVIILLVTWTLRVLVLRTQQLDGMSVDEIRSQAALGKDKYRVTPGDLSNIRIVAPKNPGPAIKHVAEATFKHASGSWKLLLFSPQDVRQAIAAFRQLFVRDLEVDPGLQNL